jgi:imidazolonepropionase-like amidohydrolase
VSTAFVNATVIDGLGGVRERQRVVVDGNRIVEVAAETAAPSGGNAGTTYDLQGRVLIPGLIDTHLHFAGGDYDPDHENDSVGLASLRSADAARRSLLAGFTTIRSAGARDHLDIDARDAVNQGAIIGPRIVASGRGVTMTGGHVHDRAIEADGVDEVRKAVRTLVKRGADSIKIFAISAGVSTAGAEIDTEAYSVEEIRAAVVEAAKARKLNQTHSIGLTGTKNAIAAGVSSIDHGIYLDEEACQQMKERGIFLVPTFGPFYYYAVRRVAEPWRCVRAEPTLEPHRASFRMAMEMGVPIAMGSDLGAPSRMKNGENALELWLMVDAGMSPADAIVTATSSAARLLRLDHLIGSVEAGKLADLIVVGRNPLDDISALQDDIKLVMRDGVVYRDELDA